jgi:hypothetical protein
MIRFICPPNAFTIADQPLGAPAFPPRAGIKKPDQRPDWTHAGMFVFKSAWLFAD